MLVKTNQSGLYKDKKSGAVVNKNDDQFLAFKTRRDKIKNDLSLQAKVNRLEDEVGQLKEHVINLTRLIEGLNGKNT